MSRESRRSVWQPGDKPAWAQALNEMGPLQAIELGEMELLEAAMRSTGLDDFGAEDFREPFSIFVRALEDEANLNFIGRVMARSDTIGWLENRLRMTDWRKRHPEIAREDVSRPLFITGLPRTGTSILHELLGCDPAHRVPQHWEVRHPCPPPETASYASDPRIARGQREIELWNAICPEYATMHELGAQIPVECIYLSAPSFRSDELSGRHIVPSYGAWLAGADHVPAYEWHRDTLQLLQWRCPRERWALKAPSHLGSLDALLAVYPEARIVQTHRDPLKVIPSVISILFATSWIRTDELDVDSLLQWFGGESCLMLLGNAMRVRDTGVAKPGQFHDVRYADLVGDPLPTLAGIYDHFGLEFSADAESAMRNYLAHKPKGKHGAHRYRFEDTGLDAAAERERFRDYQERFGVPSET